MGQTSYKLIFIKEVLEPYVNKKIEVKKSPLMEISKIETRFCGGLRLLMNYGELPRRH